MSADGSARPREHPHHHKDNDSTHPPPPPSFPTNGHARPHIPSPILTHHHRHHPYDQPDSYRHAHAHGHGPPSHPSDPANTYRRNEMSHHYSQSNGAGGSSSAFRPSATPFVGDHHPGRENGHRVHKGEYDVSPSGGSPGPGPATGIGVGDVRSASSQVQVQNSGPSGEKRKEFGAGEGQDHEHGSKRRKGSPLVVSGPPPLLGTSSSAVTPVLSHPIQPPSSATSSSSAHTPTTAYTHPPGDPYASHHPTIDPSSEGRKKQPKIRDRELERLERERHEAGGKLKPRRGRPSQAQLEANEEEMRLLREQALATALGGAPPATGSTAAKAGLPIPKANPEAEAEIKAKLEAHKRKKAEAAARRAAPGGAAGLSNGGPPKLLGSGGPPTLLGSGGPPTLLGAGSVSPYDTYPYPLSAMGPPPHSGRAGSGMTDPSSGISPKLPLPAHLRSTPDSMPNQRFHSPPLGPGSTGPPPAIVPSSHRSRTPSQTSGQMLPPPASKRDPSQPPPPQRHIKVPSSAESKPPTTEVKPAPATSTSGVPPLRPNDAAYQARLAANHKRAMIQNVTGPAPVWAQKRKGLTSALEYFQDPVSTLGGSVEIGSAGLARMVLFEGDVGEGYSFWGTGRSLGTAVLPFGHPRRRRSDAPGADNGNPADWSGFQDDDPVIPGSPQPQLDRSFENAAIAAGLHADNKRENKDGVKGKRISKRHLAHEAHEIAAMLLAHRARVPIAIGVSEDFKNLSWRLPRPYIVLGWFYITDAWLEPHVNPIKAEAPKSEKWVRWRFRFDWCRHGQLARPWWGEAPANQPCLFEGLEVDPDEDSDSHKVAGKDISTSETLRFPKVPGVPLHPELDPIDWQVCKLCSCASLDIYSQKEYCVNELCPRFFVEKNPEEERISRKIILRAVRGGKRVSPVSLGLAIRPSPVQGKTNSYQLGTAIGTVDETSPSRNSAGRDFWKGWCCQRCGMACERRNWKGWDCDGCGMIFEPSRRIWTAEALQLPTRPVCTGPRIDDGFARFTASTVESAMIWEDGLRICLHGIDDSTEVHHALSHHGNGFNKPMDRALVALQAQGEHEVLFRRVTEQATGPSTRLTDIGYSPFYTALTGSDATPLLEAIPSYKPKPWTEVPPVCASIQKSINSIAGRMIEGEKDFNTLLLVCMPANVPHVYVPKIKIPPQTSMAFLVLGADASFTFRKEGHKSKRDRGELVAFHGDLVLVRTATRYMEVSVKLLAFGFIAVARQVYPRQETRTGDAARPLITEATFPPPPPTVEYPIIKLQGPREDEADQPPDISVEDQGWNLGGVQIYGAEDAAAIQVNDETVENAINVKVEVGELSNATPRPKQVVTDSPVEAKDVDMATEGSHAAEPIEID